MYGRANLSAVTAQIRSGYDDLSKRTSHTRRDHGISLTRVISPETRIAPLPRRRKEQSCLHAGRRRDEVREILQEADHGSKAASQCMSIHLTRVGRWH